MPLRFERNDASLGSHRLTQENCVETHVCSDVIDDVRLFHRRDQKRKQSLLSAERFQIR